MDEVETVVEKLKQLVSDINTKNAQDTIATTDLYGYLQALLQLASSSHIHISQIVATATLTVLNEILTSKSVLITYALQSILVMIYKTIFERETPGYIIRSILQTLMNVCNNTKQKTVGGREVAIQLLGIVYEKRFHDCSSLTQDLFNIIIKYMKSSEFWLRQIANMALIPMIKGCGPLLVEFYPEIAKTIAKYVTDRSPEVRLSVSKVIYEVCKNAQLCKNKFIEVFVPNLVRGLEDDVPTVQDDYARVLAFVFYQLILEYVREQVRLKIDLARGIGGVKGNDKSPKKLTLQERLSKPKHILESYDFRSVLRYILNQMTQSNGVLRVGYLCVLNYFVRTTASELDKSDFEWLVMSIVEILQDPIVSNLSSEELVFFRSRVSFTLHTIASSLTESQQLHMAAILCQYLASMDQRSDHCLHLALAELGNLITSLGENSASIAANIQGGASVHLHSPSFAVRSQAAYLLAALSLAVPLIAVEILKSSLSNAKSAAIQITSTEFLGKVEGVAQSAMTMRNPQTVKLLQKMFFFHGHILVLSIILKSESSLPVGISNEIIYDIFDFGLELIQHDVLRATEGLRQLLCNLVRAGASLITSCVSLGGDIVLSRLKYLTICCTNMIAKSSSISKENTEYSTTSISNNEDDHDDDLLFNMMIIEAAILCLSSVLWYIPDIIHTDVKYTQMFAECVEKAYKAVHEIFYEKYKSHYRLRTLQVIIIECFSMLPTSVCSNTLFNGAFQIFRNSTLAGVESDQFSKLAESKRVFEILTTEGLSKPNFAKTIWKSLDYDILMLKLESNAYPLYPKESEASVATFKNKFAYSYEKEINIKEYSPCARIDSRCVDASSSILAIIFAREIKENQDKLIQFCCEAINQVLTLLTTNQSAANLFVSDEEKKRKLRVHLTTIKNCIFVFYSIVNQYNFPSGVSAYDPSLSWIHNVANSMISLLNYNDYDIRITASYTISLLVFKVSDFDITESITRKVLGFLIWANDSKLESNKIDWNSYCGHFVVLSNMWTSIEKRFITKEDVTKAIFGTLKRIDSSYSFRAHSLFALTIIASSKQKAEHLEKEVKLAFFETTFRIAEKHLLNASILDDSTFYHEFDLIICCILRLINVCVSVIAALYPHSSIIKRSCNLWRIMSTLSSHMNFTYESIEFLTLVLCSSSGYLDSQEIITFISTIMNQQILNSFNSRLMFGLIKVADALTISDPEGAFRGGVHFLLFKLIDKAVSSLSNYTQPGYFGLEFKSDPSNEEYLVRNVIDLAEVTLKKLVVNYCKRDPDRRVMPFFLFCRAICLSNRANDENTTTSTSTTMKVHTNTTTEEEKERERRGSVGTPVVVVVSLFRQYVSWSLSQANIQSKEVSLARSHVKCVAISCATECLKDLVHGSIYHTNTTLARLVIEKIMVTMENSSTESLEAIPCYASLFIEDMISLCCTCATYTVDDIQLRSLQYEALHCLAVMISFFKNTLDPDSIMGEFILSQFMSQIMSAIRPCLNVKYNSKLLSSAGSVMILLTQYRFLDDKVLLKRISRLMFPFLHESSNQINDTTLMIDEENSTNSTNSYTNHNGNNNTTAAIVIEMSDKDISEEYGAADHTVALGLAARLYTLSHITGHLAPRQDVGDTIHHIFEKSIHHIVRKWILVVESTTMVVHGSKGLLQIDDYKLADANLLANLANSKLVRRTLVAALPYAIVATICSGKLEHKEVLFLLASLTCTVNESGINTLVSHSDINTLKFASLLGLIHVFDYSNIESSIPEHTWLNIIRKLLGTLKTNTFTIMEKLNYIDMLLQLASCLQRYLVINDSTSSSIVDITNNRFVQWLWLFYLNIFTSLLPNIIYIDSELNREEPLVVQLIMMNCFPSPINRFDILLDSEQNINMNDHHTSKNNMNEEKTYHILVLSKLVKGQTSLSQKVIPIQSYVVHQLLAIIYRISLYNDESSKMQVTDIINQFVEFILKSSSTDTSLPVILDLLLTDLYEWQSRYLANPELPILSGYVNLPTIILDIWCQIANSYTPKIVRNSSLVKLQQLFTKDIYHVTFLSTVLEYLISIAYHKPNSAKNIIMETVLPITITCLWEGGYPNPLERQFVLLLFAYYDSLEQEQSNNKHQRYMEVVIKSILQLLQRHRKVDSKNNSNNHDKEDDHNSSYVSMSHLCGLGITRFVKQSPEIFRAVLSQLTDENKMFLQMTMKNAVLAQSSANIDNHGGGEVIIAKKLDISKFKMKA